MAHHSSFAMAGSDRPEKLDSLKLRHVAATGSLVYGSLYLVKECVLQYKNILYNKPITDYK